MLKIDTHTHIMPKSLPDWSRKLGYGAFIHLEHHKEGAARMMQGDRFFREVQANCWDAEIRIEEYARSGVQVQVICTIPVLFAYWAKPEDTHDIARFLNDDVARGVLDDRFGVGAEDLAGELDGPRAVQIPDGHAFERQISHEWVATVRGLQDFRNASSHSAEPEQADADGHPVADQKGVILEINLPGFTPRRSGRWLGPASS